jgi:hypothetical protein
MGTSEVQILENVHVRTYPDLETPNSIRRRPLRGPFLYDAIGVVINGLT